MTRKCVGKQSQKVAADKLKSHFSISSLVLYKYSLLSTCPQWLCPPGDPANGGERHSGLDALETNGDVIYNHSIQQD